MLTGFVGAVKGRRVESHGANQRGTGRHIRVRRCGLQLVCRVEYDRGLAQSTAAVTMQQKAKEKTI